MAIIHERGQGTEFLPSHHQCNGPTFGLLPSPDVYLACRLLGAIILSHLGTCVQVKDVSLTQPAEEPDSINDHCALDSPTSCSMTAAIPCYQAEALPEHLRSLLLRDNDSGSPCKALIRAAQNGQVDARQWLRTQQPPCPWSPAACTAAATNGHLATLQWLRSQHPCCPWDPASCGAEAAANGHQAVLLWLQKKCSSVFDDTCAWAARQGQLQALEIMTALDPLCPVGRDSVRAAVLGGHLPILEWLILRPNIDLSGCIIYVGSHDAICLLQKRDLLIDMPFDRLWAPVSQTDLKVLSILEPVITAQGQAGMLTLVEYIIIGAIAFPDSRLRGKFPHAAHLCGSGKLDILDWLFARIQCLTTTQTDYLYSIPSFRGGSILLVQLAMRHPEYHLHRDGITHSRTAARGDMELLRWLVAQPAADELRWYTLKAAMRAPFCWCMSMRGSCLRACRAGWLMLRPSILPCILWGNTSGSR